MLMKRARYLGILCGTSLCLFHSYFSAVPAESTQYGWWGLKSITQIFKEVLLYSRRLYLHANEGAPSTAQMLVDDQLLPRFQSSMVRVVHLWCLSIAVSFRGNVLGTDVRMVCTLRNVSERFGTWRPNAIDLGGTRCDVMGLEIGSGSDQ